MPTPHKRIPVTRDQELTDALARVAPYYADTAQSRIVHDLAVKGAEAILEEKRADGDAIEQLVSVSTERADLIDWNALERIDEVAWGE